MTGSDFMSNYVNQLKAEYFDIFHSSIEQWKKDMEERALSEYHNRKIKIEDQKI